MNVIVCDKNLAVAGVTVAGSDYTNRAGAELILATWANRASRTWMPSGEDTLVIAQQNAAGGTDLTAFPATEPDLYSLEALRTIIGDLAWAEGVSEPSIEDQEIIRAEIISRVELGGLPESIEALEALVFAIVAEVSR